MSYPVFNNLSELINGDLAAKIGRGILSKYLLDRECNCSLPSKVNEKCVYEVKCRSKCLTFEVKLLMYDAIYIGNTQEILKKMDGNFSDLLRLLKNGHKSDSFAAHSEKNFNTTTSRTDLRKYMTFKVGKKLKPIGAMKKFTKPNCNLCMEKHLTTLKRYVRKISQL